MNQRTLRTLVAACQLALGLQLAGCTRVVWEGRSQDRLHDVRIEAKLLHQQLFIDNEAFASRTRRIAVQSLHLRPEEQCIVYLQHQGQRWQVVRNGRAGPSFRAIASLTVASNCRVAYAARRRGHWHLVDGNLEGETLSQGHEAILADSITFDTGGEHLAYAARDGQDVRVVLNGKAGPAWQGVAEIQLRSSDTKDRVSLSYIGRRKEQRHVVHAGKVGPGYAAIAELEIGDYRNDAPAPRFAYFGQRQGQWHAVVDGIEGSAAAAFDRLRFSPDGQRLAYVRRDADGQDRVVLDGQVQPSHGQVRKLSFSDDSTHFSYVTRNPRADHLVRNGQPGPAFVVVDSFVESADGQHWGYLGIDQDLASVMINGREAAQIVKASELQLDEEGRHWGLIQIDELEHVIIDGESVGAFKRILPGSLTLSGGNWGCVVANAGERAMYFVVDGKRGRELALEELLAEQQRLGKEGLGMALDPLHAIDLRAWVKVEIRRAQQPQNLSTTDHESADLATIGDPRGVRKACAQNPGHRSRR